MNAPGILAGLALGAALASLAGCFGEGDGDPDKGYTPVFTEPKGTLHAGDYFPLAGEPKVLQGGLSGSVRSTMSGVSQGKPVSVDETEAIGATLLGRVEVGPAMSLTLSKGTFTVVPVSTTTTSMTEADGVIDQETSVSTSYFEKTASAISILAEEDAAGALVELPQTLFMRLPLKVGDSWESVAKEAPPPSDQGMTMDLTARSRTWVVGKEAVTLGNRTLSALRLDQSSVLSGTAVAADGTRLAIKGHSLVTLYLEEGKGEVRQRNSMGMTLSGTSIRGADRVNLAFTLNIEGDLSVAEGSAASEAAPARAQGPAAGSTRPAPAEAAAKAAWETALRGLRLRAP